MARARGASAALIVIAAIALAPPISGRAQTRRERPPARARVLRALESRGLPQPLLPIGGVIAAGGGRAVAVVGAPHGRFLGECNPGAWDLYAAVVASEGAQLRVLGLVELPTQAMFASACEGQLVAEPGSNLPRVATARAADLDQDGETEVSIVLEYQNPPECGSGFIVFRQLYVIDLDPTPSLAASILSGVDPQAMSYPQLRGTVLFEDANGDGHTDLVLRTRECEFPEGDTEERVCARPERIVHAWSAERDAWTEVPRGVPASSTPCDGE